MFISPAYAQTAGGLAGGFDIMALLPLVLIFVVFYFLIIRPQQKKVKQHKSMVDALRRGDKVITSGGIIGTVAKVINDREVQLEIADGVKVRAVRGMISEVMARTEPAAGKAGEEKDEDAPYYKALGLKIGASGAAIEAAYAGKSGDSAAAEAYETLKDPVKRRLYDRLGHDEYVSVTKA